MNKQIAIELKQESEIVAKKFSSMNREGNFNEETFQVDEVIPMSDHTACVIFKKNTAVSTLVYSIVALCCH